MSKPVIDLEVFDASLAVYKLEKLKMGYIRHLEMLISEHKWNEIGNIASRLCEIEGKISVFQKFNKATDVLG